MGCQLVVSHVSVEERRVSMLAVVILVVMIVMVMLIPIIFPIQDEPVAGFMCEDKKVQKWLVYLTNRTIPKAFDSEEEAQGFLNESITHSSGR